MRVTNKMTSNQLLLNLNKNMNTLNFLQYQSSTGNKIRYASDNPIIAGRSLKFRTNIVEVEQYISNVSQGKSWLQTSANAVKNVMEALVNSGENSIRSLLVSAGGVSTVSDSKIYANQLKETLREILGELNTSYAGRYVFSGFKTDEKPVFDVDNSKTVQITEGFDIKDIQEDYRVYTKANEFAMPEEVSCKRLKLAYSEGLSSVSIPGFTVTTVTSDAANAYKPAAGEVNFIQDTGELIFGDDAYASIDNAFATILDDMTALQTQVQAFNGTTSLSDYEAADVAAQALLAKVTALVNEKKAAFDPTSSEYGELLAAEASMNAAASSIKYIADNYPVPANDILTAQSTMQTAFLAVTSREIPMPLDVTYTKTGFKAGDLNPKAYFKCVENGVTSEIDGQFIKYEFGINNKMQVNSLAKDILTTGLINDINDVISLIENANVSDKETLMKAPPDGAGLTSEQADQQIKDENKFYIDMIGNKLTQLIGKLDKHATYLSQENTSIGARLSRLDLIENRLQDDRVNFEDLKAENDYVDAEEVYIRYQSMLSVYNAALQTGANIVQMTLVNFI